MSKTSPSRDESRTLSHEHRLIPVHRELLADYLTPVRAYALLCPPGERGFLLESVEGGERLARFSFIGFQPRPYELARERLSAERDIPALRTPPITVELPA